jgi:2-isopropylmalate synthase
LVEDSASGVGEAGAYELEYIHVTSGTTMVPTATVRVRQTGAGADGESKQDSAPGNGAVDAAMKAIDRVLGRQGHLVEYHVQAVTGGQDALAEVTLKVDFGDSKLITGKGASTDVIEASARAYLHAVGRALVAPATIEVTQDTP